MKRLYQQFGVGSLLVLLTALITLILSATYAAGQPIGALQNLFFVPILLAAVFLGEGWCVIIALLCAVGSSITEHGLNLPSSALAWGNIGIRGAFFLTIGYLASYFADRLHKNAASWHSLLGISRAINASLDIDMTLETITRESVALTSADACAIRMLSDDGTEFMFVKSYGLSEKYLMKGPLRREGNDQVESILKGNEILTHDVRKAKHLQYQKEMLEEGIISIMSVPLCIDSHAIGMLNLYRKRFPGFPNRDHGVARAFAEQASIAIRNAGLYKSIQKNYLDTVRALTRAIEAKDSSTLGHSERVAEVSVRISQELGLSGDDIQTIEFGALLHDLGKITLDDSTLIKTGHLSVDETMQMEMHPMIGKSILEPVEFLRPAIPIVLYHHERWDGLGYPGGLSGEEIPLTARIVAVANGLDHIVHSSPFPVPAEVAVDELQRHAGALYDPHLVEILVPILLKQESTPLQEDVAMN